MAKDNFAVAADDATIARGKDLLEKVKRPEDKNNGDTLTRLFDIVEKNLDNTVLEQNGVDVMALDSAISNIRRIFVSSVSGRDQILADKDSAYAQLEDEMLRSEKEHKKALDDLTAEKKDAEAKSAEEEKKRKQVEKDLGAEIKLREAAEATAATKQELAESLTDELAKARKKAADYDTLKEGFDAVSDELETVKREASDAAKDVARKHEKELGDLEIAAERAQAKAVEAVRETLQQEIDGLKDSLREARSEANSAKKDVETARASAFAELNDEHQHELRELRSKIDIQTQNILDLNNQLTEAKIQAGRASAEISRLTAEVDRLNLQIDALQV